MQTLNFAGGTVQLRAADSGELIESAKSWIRVASDALARHEDSPVGMAANEREARYALEHAARALAEVTR